MLQALLDDLVELDGVEVLTTRDARFPPLPSCIESIEIHETDDVWQQWDRCIQQSDAVWPVAPESGGVLGRLSWLAARHDKPLFGCSPQAVEVAASKLETARMLAIQGVSVVPTYPARKTLPDWPGAWVLKPDDGAGCEDTRWFPDFVTLQAWLVKGGGWTHHVAQPYLSGLPASLSMLCRDGRAWLLSCNRQLVTLQEGNFSYDGSIVNGMKQYWNTCDLIAAEVAAAIPGLAGYVGIDVLIDEGRVTVLEVNPRLTTSYAGLRRAIGCNPARLVVDLFYNDNFQLPPMMARDVVEILLHA
jgi:predicted ATP-grasp superfamily ATP-dependent carboligase